MESWDLIGQDALSENGTFGFTATYRDEANALVNLTGWTGKMQGRLPDRSLAWEASTSNGRMTLGGAAGTIAVTIPPAAFAGLGGRSGMYDIVLTDSTGALRNLWPGRWEVRPGVTQ